MSKKVVKKAKKLPYEVDYFIYKKGIKIPDWGGFINSKNELVLGKEVVKEGEVVINHKNEWVFKLPFKTFEKNFLPCGD